MFLFANHDGLSKFLFGFHPIVTVVWVHYLVHILLTVVVFVSYNGPMVIRNHHPLM